MGHQLHRRALSLVIAATILLAAACSTGGSKSGSTTILSAGSEETPAASPASTDASTTATLHAETAGVLVNDVEVPNGETRPITIDERIVLGPGSRARLRVGELDVLLTGGDCPTGRLGIRGGRASTWRAASMDSTLDERFARASAADDLVPDHDPDGAARHEDHRLPRRRRRPASVCDNGEAEWEQQGKIERYAAPQCSFAHAGSPLRRPSAFRTEHARRLVSRRSLEARGRPTTSGRW